MKHKGAKARRKRLRVEGRERAVIVKDSTIVESKESIPGKTVTNEVHCRFYDETCKIYGSPCPHGLPHDVTVDPEDGSGQWCQGECQFKHIQTWCER